MIIKNITDPAFLSYGKVIDGYDLAPLLNALEETPKPSGSVVYVPSETSFEALAIKEALSNNVYGGMPIQLGYCNGENYKLNCLEYHRDCELNIALDDVVLLLARLQDVKGYKLDTSKVEAFLLPAGTMVQIYETTLHYAPCSASSGSGFRVVIVLPLGTNTEKPEITIRNPEDRLLFARNKWLLAHPGSNEAKSGAFVGLTGQNIIME